MGSSAKSYERQLVMVLTVVGGVAALDTQAVFYLIPFIAPELHLNNVQTGLIGSAVLIGWSVAAFIVARLSDRMGKRKPFLVGAFLAFAALSGLSALTATFAQLLVARLVIGFAEGPVLPMAHSLVMSASAPERRGLNMGLVQNLGSQIGGSMLAPVLLVWLAQHFGWRSAFLVSAVPGLIAALLVWAFVHETKASPASRDHGGGDPSSLKDVWASHNVRVCVAVGTCCVGWYFLLLTFLPVLLTRYAGLAPLTMSFIVSMIGAAGVVGSVVVAGLSDRIGRRQAIALFCALGMLAPLAPLVLPGGAAAMAALVFVGALMVGTFSIFMGTLPQESVDPRNGATATALVMAVAQIVGGTLGPTAGGFLADRIAPEAPLVLAALLALAATFLSFLIRNPDVRPQGGAVMPAAA